MKEHYDPWYVRLPDGRVTQAKSTASVRHHVEAGNIPLNSLARREPDDEWVQLTWIAEFANLTVGGNSRSAASSHEVSNPPSPKPSGSSAEIKIKTGVSARLDPMRLQTVGVRGLIDELIAAFDSTLSQGKMLVAFAVSVSLYVAIFLVNKLVLSLDGDWHFLAIALSAVLTVGMFSVLNAYLGRMTHLELSSMRPSSAREGMQDLTRFVVPVVIASGIVAGGALTSIYFLHKIPEWIGKLLFEIGMGATMMEIIFTPVAMILLVVAVLLWLLIGLSWLISPAIVVEESSWMEGLREWRHLLKEHFSRILIYEGMAIFLGIIASLPFTMAVGMARNGTPAMLPSMPRLLNAGKVDNWFLGSTEAALQGLTAAPFLALLAVANVFIYLNLRYEYNPQKKS